FGDDEEETALPACRGRWPHLRKYSEDACDRPAKAILLGASNSWFPVLLSALSVPTQVDKLAQLLVQHSALFDTVESPQTVKLPGDVGVLRPFAAYTDEQVWEALQQKRQGEGEAAEEPTDLREPEWQIFSNPDPARNGRDFQLRQVDVPKGYKRQFDKVVLAERLREVRALVGFTR